jgi:hypothetical protein
LKPTSTLIAKGTLHPKLQSPGKLLINDSYEVKRLMSCQDDGANEGAANPAITKFFPDFMSCHEEIPNYGGRTVPDPVLSVFGTKSELFAVTAD